MTEQELTTHIKSVMESWRERGAEITPFYASPSPAAPAMEPVAVK